MALLKFGFKAFDIGFKSFFIEFKDFAVGFKVQIKATKCKIIKISYTVFCTTRILLLFNFCLYLWIFCDIDSDSLMLLVSQVIHFVDKTVHRYYYIPSCTLFAIQLNLCRLLNVA